MTGTRKNQPAGTVERAARRAWSQHRNGPDAMYRVLHMDGDLFVNRNEEAEFTLRDAEQIAQAIGGTVEQIEA